MNDYNQSSPSDDSFVKLSLPYCEFDILLSDIGEEDLQLIGRLLKREHLSLGVFSDPVFPISGRIYGPNVRYMISLMCRLAEKVTSPIINVVFLVDTRSPYTCLSQKTMNVIFGTENTLYAEGEYKSIAIQDSKSVIECHISKAHYADVNILGADAMRKLELSIIVNWSEDEFRLMKM